MERYRPNTHKIKASTRLSAVTGESMMPKIKEINLDLRKIIVDAHKAGNGYTELSQRFHISRTGVRRILGEPHSAEQACLR